MTTYISRWGNSLALRIPKAVADAAGITNGSAVRVRVSDSGTILVVPVTGVVAVEAGQVVARKAALPSLKDW